MVINSATIAHKVSQCAARIAVLGQGLKTLYFCRFYVFIFFRAGGLSTEVVKYLAKYGTMSVIIVPTGTVVRLSKSMRFRIQFLNLHLK
jgi:hypothetical protein